MNKESLKNLAVSTKAFLSRPAVLENRIYLKIVELQRFRDLATQVTQALKLVTVYTGPGRKIEECAVMIADLEQEVARTSTELIEAQKDVKEAISWAEDESVRYVLTARYVSRLSWNAVAGYFGASDRWVFRLHRRGLEELSRIAAEKLEEVPAHEETEPLYDKKGGI